MLRSTTLSAMLLAASLQAFAASSAPESPEVYPLCYNPQPIAPPQSAFPAAASPFTLRPAIAWTGSEYAMLWSLNSGAPTFNSLFTDGTLRLSTAPATGVTLTTTSPTAMAWDGAQFGVAVAGRMAGDTLDQIYFYRLSRDGVMIGSPVRVSQTAGAPTAAAANPQIAAATGGRFGVVWNDARSGNQDVYMSGVQANGALAFADLLLSIGPAAGDQTLPVIAPAATFPSYGMVVVAWQDFRSAAKWELYSAAVTVAGGAIYSGPNLTVSPPAPGNSTAPALAARGNEMGLAWVDTRDGNSEIYFATLYDSSGKITGDIRLTNDTFLSDQPRVASTGGEYEVIWRDNRTAAAPFYWQRVADDATPVGVNQKLSSLGYGQSPDAVWNGTALGIATFKYGWLQMQYEAFGCTTDYSPPSCSGNYLAYNITGTTASISWTPASDPDSGVAYYQLFRNNVAYAKTSDTFFNDSGLNLSTTYNYSVQPVNGYQLQNGNCTASVYLKTNATLTLLVNKSTPDALLNWNDAGLNNYNVFRGTDPRVMQQIGQTPALSQPDPGALGNAVSYFYTVDDPGI